jgi:hypothetical protein
MIGYARDCVSTHLSQDFGEHNEEGNKWEWVSWHVEFSKNQNPQYMPHVLLGCISRETNVLTMDYGVVWFLATFYQI